MLAGTRRQPYDEPIQRRSRISSSLAWRRQVDRTPPAAQGMQLTHPWIGDPDTRSRLAHVLASLAFLLTVLATSVTGQALAQNGSSLVDPTADEPVSAAAFVVDGGGQTAGVYGWDSMETSGALCGIEGFMSLNYVRVNPIQVYAVEGHIGQRVTVDAMAGTVNGELLDADSWKAKPTRKPAMSGSPPSR